MQVWRMEVDGSDPTHMVKEDANCWFPHVSPDGNWVVYIAYGKNDVPRAITRPTRTLSCGLSLPVEENQKLL